VRNAVRDEVTQLIAVTDPVEMGAKWTGGKIEIWPKDPSSGAKELPIDTLFHKIVMVRDQLRVLEQKINGHALSDEDKVNLQQYITRCYGSLTTFNALFKHKEDHFTGARGSKDE
jgi:hypothetical protein